MRSQLTAMLAAPVLLLASACSQETEDNAQQAAEYAAEDAKANAEVIENEVREGAIVAADKVSEGAQKLGEELRSDERTDADQGDGQLDGTD
ncbi:hypothetical protein ACXYL9_03365 [Qipengyuania sp. CAU 1752]